jgi:hypothetical protein
MLLALVELLLEGLVGELLVVVVEIALLIEESCPREQMTMVR